MDNRFQITEYCHHFLEEYLAEGDICVDATAGNGNDTEFLCRRVGKTGKVYAFDIQDDAIAHTGKRVVFNFGYLPGGDHSIATKCETSLEAVRQAMELLQMGGILNLCIYSGKDTGYEEKEALLSFLKELDNRKWLVLVHSYYNRGNNPPLPVFVIRLK